MDRDNKQRKLALIIGGSTGLGYASARKLAMNGFDLFIVHRTRRNEREEVNERFAELEAAGAEVRQFNADAVNRDKRREILRSLKEECTSERKVSLLLHSLAKGNLKKMTDSNEQLLSGDDFKVTVEAMGINLYEWARSLFDMELFDSDSRIISFTSEGNQKAWPYYGAVSAAKAALEAITRNLALEFAPYGITSNCIQAGITDTASLRRIPGHTELIEAARKRNPMKRLTRPEDVANVVYLLTRPEARWINGSILKADGGESLQ
ncbi:SDR family oxidoreductase [Robertkochia aurantiaca]|uniref:SDR family oxidoreductase n=1 Tax=Robertkochia aurantiaca TaxID=2873700 RepID=UPI001CCE4A2B|nr:SDR family oxidoreductase [Robertkochia sp. 3YJGBD-33]